MAVWRQDLSMKMMICTLLLVTGLAARAGEAPAETATAGLKEKGLELIKQLGSDDFAVREDADKKIVALGEPAVEIIKSLPKSEVAEVALRLHKIRTLFSIVEVKTLAEALALRLKFLDDDKAELAAAALKKAETLGKPLEIAQSLYQSGLGTYRQFKQDGHDKNRLLKRVANEMDLCVEYFQTYLKDHPDDKAVEANQAEASMILYSCRKYMSL